MLLEKSVRFGDFTLASGAKSDFYVDCRVTSMDSYGAKLIGDIGWSMVQGVVWDFGGKVEAIGGLTMGADPISLAIAMQSSPNLNAFSVRKAPKNHGTKKLIEGNFKSGQTVIVVDDVITTGGSTIQAIEAIRNEGGKVAFAIVMVDREEGGKTAIESLGVPVYAMTTKAELRSIAVASGASSVEKELHALKMIPQDGLPQIGGGRNTTLADGLRGVT
jgi:orotate phosphoribosyltransferase